MSEIPTERQTVWKTTSVIPTERQNSVENKQCDSYGKTKQYGKQTVRFLRKDKQCGTNVAE
jgi:hypothetical protein